MVFVAEEMDTLTQLFLTPQQLRFLRRRLVVLVVVLGRGQDVDWRSGESSPIRDTKTKKPRGEDSQTSLRAFTCDVEEDAVVAEGGAAVQARVRQLHALDLQPPVADARVLAVRHRRMVFGPVDDVGGVLVRAAQVQTFAGVAREQLDRHLHRH